MRTHDRKEKKMTKLSKKLMILIITVSVCAVIIAGLIVGNVICGKNFNIITSYFNGLGMDETANEAEREFGKNLSVTVEQEGAVLLQNNNNVLPLSPSESGKIKVNLFGWASCDAGFIPQGTGSGTGSRDDMTTFPAALKEVGYEINEELNAAYNALGYERVEGGSYVIEASSDEKYKKFYGVNEAPISFLTAERMGQAKEFSDTAIIVLGRLLGEGNDYSHKQYKARGDNATDRHLLQLSSEEEEMIKLVGKNFDKVVLVLNTSNPLELGFVEDPDYGIDSVVYMGYPGTRGTVGVANLLAGKSDFMGRLSDTYAYDLSTNPSFAISGREGDGYYVDHGRMYADYSEDIYVGYKWYETAYADGFWDSEYAKQRWGIENGYDDVVQYPFGYGMSLSKFDWQIKEVRVNGQKGTIDGVNEIKNKTDVIEVDVQVTNKGKIKSRDVIQLYYSAPYTVGGIEKSAVNLGAFVKTYSENADDPALAPEESEVYTISLPVEQMKSYDCYDRNNNGFMGYELEKGEYSLSLRTDAHTVKEGCPVLKFSVPDSINGGFRYETDSVTGNKVENRFTTYKNTVSGAESKIYEPVIPTAHSIDGNDEDIKITYLTRKDFSGTFPERNVRNAGAKLIAEDLSAETPVSFDGDEAPVFGDDMGLWIEDMMGVEYDDELWDIFISQIDYETCAKLITSGGFGTIAVPVVNKKKTSGSDGPSGWNSNVLSGNNMKAANFPSDTIIACTWDWQVARAVGAALGAEGAKGGLMDWYGPGANLHRTPLGGRNFEYYSEDPYLSGIICAYHVLGAKSEGVTAYIKHFAVNDTETGRGGKYVWLTEQNLRENYLLPFELAVKVGKSNAMMSSISRVGSVRVSASYALLTSVLRDEWGFRGTVITDFFQNSGNASQHAYHDVNECIRSGNSMLLWQDGAGLKWFKETDSATTMKYIHKSAKDILFTYTDTLDYAIYSGSGSFEDFGSNDVFPYWIFLLIGIDVLFAGLMAFWIILALRGFLKARKTVDAT